MNKQFSLPIAMMFFYARWQLCYGNVMQEMAEISIKRERFLFPRNFSANSHREAIK